MAATGSPRTMARKVGNRSFTCTFMSWAASSWAAWRNEDPVSEQPLDAQLMDDLKVAMKAGNTTARDTIRFTMSSLKNARIEKGSELTRQEAIAVLQRDAKRRQESI